MKKKSQKQSQDLLKTKIVDLIDTAEGQLAYARRSLGPDASDEAVLKEAQTRAEKAAETRANLEKPLGTTMRPFPMWGSQRIEHSDRADLQQVLSVIADDSYPMMVYSDRPYKEVVALAYCDMPVPSMLHLFFKGLERRRPESTNRTQMMIGDPGHGKSFLGAMQGRLRSNGSIEVLDCGGKNMRELLFEMVLDFGSADALPEAIDKRIAGDKLQPMSIALLKQIDDDIAEAIKAAGSDKDEVNALAAKRLVTIEDGEITAIDWEGLKTAGNAKVAATFDILKKVSTIEGLDNAGGNALGMNSQYGPIIRKFIAGEEIVLDEYNKSIDGTDNNLQTVWQFFIGEIATCTVENPLKNKDASSGPSEFTFNRDDMKVGCFITLTGNKKEDGITTHSLSKSAYSRLSPDTLPDPEVADWQHRICQMMVGVPVSTLYTAFKEQADADPHAFGEWLLWLRRTKAEIEGVPVPEMQETLLINWKKVINSTERLANFYDTWAEMTDAEKILINNPDLIDEVDEEYSKKEGVDFRKIKQHLEEAIPMRPRMQQEEAPRFLSLGKWESAPKLTERIPENPSLHLGTRLVEFLENTVYEKTAAVGKEKLYEKLKMTMDKCGLRDIKLQEGAYNGNQSVEESLNISAFSDINMSRQAEMAQKIFCDYIRQVDPEITAENDSIVTTKKLRDAMTYVSERNTADTNELYIPNRDHETLVVSPLTQVTIKDEAVFQREGASDMEFAFADIVRHEDLIASFALPTVGAKNLSSIWEQNIRPLTKGDAQNPDNANFEQYDDGMLIAENRSDSKIGTTSLQVAYKGADGKDTIVSVHVIRNETRNKTLIISEKVPSKLLSAFMEAGITHIDRHGDNAATKVEAALTDLTRGMNANIRTRLSEAFLYRNELLDDPEKAKTLSLPQLLVDDSVSHMYGKYVVKTPKSAAKP